MWDQRVATGVLQTSKPKLLSKQRVGRKMEGAREEGGVILLLIERTRDEETRGERGEKFCPHHTIMDFRDSHKPPEQSSLPQYSADKSFLVGWFQASRLQNSRGGTRKSTKSAKKSAVWM